MEKILDTTEKLARSGLLILNCHCIYISKRRVHRVFQEIFGYGYELDPSTHHGPMVVKSTENATHDGRIEMGPIRELKRTLLISECWTIWTRPDWYSTTACA